MAGPLDIVADLLGFGGPSGTDGGSSNWAAWGHAEIRSMLDTSVDPGDIIDAADGWRDLSRHASDLVTGLTRDLNDIVSGGWHGTAADAAVAALRPINQWSASAAEAAEHTTALMDASGTSAGQAKATVPAAQPHDWGQSLRSFALGGLAGGVIDAVAQDRAQAEAHAEAVQIMNNVYSTPINDHRVAVPTYPPLADPTLQPPEQLPETAPAPGLGQTGDSLHWPTTWVDSVWLADAVAEQPVRVIAARGGAAGVCALQHPDQPGATLLEVIPATSLAAAVVSRLPSHPPGRSAAVTVQPHSTQPAGGLLVAASPVRTSAERDLAAAAAILDRPHVRAGQIAANVRDPSGQVRRSDVLRWCDNADGRYHVMGGESTSMTIGPSDPQRLGDVVQRLLAALQPR